MWWYVVVCGGLVEYVCGGLVEYVCGGLVEYVCGGLVEYVVVCGSVVGMCVSLCWLFIVFFGVCMCV